MLRVCGALLASAAFLALATPASADTIETVVVSAPHYVPKQTNDATKMDVPLIETPQAVSVITRDQIDLLNWQNLGQAVRYTAGITGENYGSDERYDWLTLRGFNPVEFIDGLQAPVGSVSSAGVDLYGFQTVEVLKGPSSTLYGLAPPGGIVNVASRRPQADFGGEAQILYGEYSNLQLAGDVTGALDDDGEFLGRMTALGYTRGTQTDGVRSNRVYLAPSFTWNIAPDTSLTLLNYFQYDNVRGDGGGFLPIYGVALPNPLGKVPTDTNLGDTKYNDYRRAQFGTGYEFTHQFSDWLGFTQNLKFFGSDAHMLDVYGAGLLDANGDGVPDDYRTVQRYNFPFNENVQSFNVDNRLAATFDTGPVSHRLLAGLDYRNYMDVSSNGFSLAPPIDLFHPQHVQPITTPSMAPYAHERQNQTGLYAEDEMKLDRWVLTLGGRNDWLSETNTGTKTDTAHFTYRAGLNYVSDIGLAPYIAYATSFQPTSGADFEGHSFKPTSGNQIEGGVKFQPTFLPQNVNALATADVYRLVQNNVLTPDPDPTHPFFSVQAGQVRVQGFELEGVARIFDRISLNASYSYTDSKVLKSNGADLDQQLTIVPRNKISGYADYTQQTGLFAGLGAGFGVRYTSDYYGNAANTLRSPPVALFDAILHYDTQDWRLQVNASNLLDRTYLSRCSDVTQCFYGLRRDVTVTLSRKF